MSERGGMSDGSSLAQDLLRAAGFAALYYALGMLAYHLLAHPGGVSGVWPQSGLALGVLLLLRERRAIALVLVAELGANLAGTLIMRRSPWLPGLGLALTDCAESLLAAWAIRRYLGGAIPTLTSAREAATLVVIGAGACNAITAVAGAAIFHLAFQQPFGSAWRAWWIADGLGMVVVAPLIIGWLGPRSAFPPRPPRRLLEGALLGALLAAAGAEVLAGLPRSHLEAELQPYLAFPLLLWAALRFGVRGASLAVLGLSVAVVATGVAGRGPFAHEFGRDVANILPALQAYVGSAALCALFPAALIEERDRTERELRRSEAQRARAQEVARLGQWVRDHLTGEERWSQELYELLGLAPGAVAAGEAALRARLHPDDLAALDRALAAEMEGSGAEVHLRFLWPDGAVRHLALRGRVEREGGQPRRAIWTFLDVTGIKRAEEALQESEQRYRTLFDRAPLGLGVADEQGNLLAFNQAMLDPGGYTRADVERIGNVAALYASQEERAAALERLRRDGVLVRHEVRFRRRDGGSYQALLTLIPIVLEGRRCALAMAEDITIQRQEEAARRALELELQQSRKMEAVGTLAAGIAHDLNNFLTVIYGALDLASRRAGDPERLLVALGELRQAADQASELTRSLLAFSRKAIRDRRPVELGALVTGALRLLRRALPATVEVVPETPAGPLWVEVDPVQVQQVLVNLAVNAGDAMPGGGRLTISVLHDGSRGPPLLPGRSAACLVVEDTGAGIPAEVRERVFEPFFTTKARERGTGLGLAVVHGIVTAHGGRVRIESEPGRGTVVAVAFPTCPAPDAAAPAAAPAAPRAAPARVLLAEDDPAVRDALRRGLGAAGHEVRAAADGEEALASFEADPPDLVVLDVDLPRRSGLSCLRELRARGSRVPVLLITGNLELSLGPDEAGPVTALLHKPFDGAVLAAACARLLEPGNGSG